MGAAVGYLFYGGIGKDEFGQPTTLTYVLNTLIPATVGTVAGIFFLPIRTEQIIKKKKEALKLQFRDMLRFGVFSTTSFNHLRNMSSYSIKS